LERGARGRPWHSGETEKDEKPNTTEGEDASKRKTEETARL